MYIFLTFIIIIPPLAIYTHRNNKFLLLLSLLTGLLILYGCNVNEEDLSAVNFRLDEDTVLTYMLNEDIGETRKDILALVDRIDYYSENVLTLTNNEKVYLFFAHLGEKGLSRNPVNVEVREVIFDDDSTAFVVTYHSSRFRSYERDYVNVETVFSCSIDNTKICSNSRGSFRGWVSGTSYRDYWTFRIEPIYIGRLIYHADSPHHDATARLAVAKTYLLNDKYSYSDTSLRSRGEVNLSYFNERCFPSLWECNEIRLYRATYTVNLENKTIDYDPARGNLGCSNRRCILRDTLPYFVMNDKVFYDYFTIFTVDTDLLYRVFDMPPYVRQFEIVNRRYFLRSDTLADLKGHFSGEQGLQNLTNYVFHE